MSTTRIIEFGALAPGLLGVALMLWSVARLLRSAFQHTDPNLCPGPRRTWVGWVTRAWLLTDYCGYDLSATAARSDGSRRCPECGAVHAAAAKLTRTSHRVRLAPLAALCMLAAAAMWNVRWIRRGGWIPYTPTSALILAQRLSGPLCHDDIRWEVHNRVRAGTLYAWQRHLVVATAIDNLRDDAIANNAEWAMSTLAALGEDSLIALEAALHSPEWQQRQLAAEVLRSWCPDERASRRVTSSPAPVYQPTPKLLEVTVEGLADDALPYATNSTTWVFNARSGYEFLRRHITQAAPYIRAGLNAGDPQQRMLCSLLAGQSRDPVLVAAAAPMLVEQLRDDGVVFNAKYACDSLLWLGRQSFRHLNRALDSQDSQQRTLAGLLVLDIVARDQRGDDCERRSELLAKGREFGARYVVSNASLGEYPPFPH
ncbi:MAG: hypothetical protein JSR77_08620 [Planctomycetes bacterium]|nr:hypothetical protein [Planctomycetota bacterium]